MHFENVASELSEQMIAKPTTISGLLAVPEIRDFMAKDEEVMYKDHAEACKAACGLQPPKPDSAMCQCRDGRLPLQRPSSDIGGV